MNDSHNDRGNGKRRGSMLVLGYYGRKRTRYQAKVSHLFALVFCFQSADTFTTTTPFGVSVPVQKFRFARRPIHQAKRKPVISQSQYPPSHSNQTIDLLLEDLGYGEDFDEHRYFDDENSDAQAGDERTDLGEEDIEVSEVSSILSNLTLAVITPEANARDDDDTLPDLEALLANLNLTIAPAETNDVYSSVLTLESLSKIANSSDIAYFYLQNELKIPSEDMWKITNEAGSILGLTARTLRHKVELLRRTMELSDEDIRTMMKRHPSVLQLSADKNLAPTILFLQRALDLSREDLRALIVPFPSILCYSMTTLKEKINVFTKILGFSIDECRSLFVNQPKLLTAGVKTGLLPRVKFMVGEMEMPIDEFRTLIKRNPLILLYSLEHNLRPKLIFFFIMTLHMDTRHLSKLLLKYPQVIDYNLENHMLPIFRYFIIDLEFSPTEVRQILLKFPRLMTWSLLKIKHVVGYFRYELGMDASQVKRILYQAPQIIGLSEATMRRKVQDLQETFSLKDEELRSFFGGMPTLIICSYEANLYPKIEFLRGILGDRELREAVLLQPSLLAYSLDKRIQPRMQAILDIGAHPRAITVGISMKDDAFRLWLNGRRSRLAQDPGYDRVNKKSGEVDLLPIVTPKVEAVDRSKRIVHWNRTVE